jgi:predicted alpha/beta-hydrolase family hydrolase
MTTRPSRPADDAAREWLVETPVGDARVHLRAAAGQGLLVLGHGAGGGIGAADVTRVATAAQSAGWTVALVEQPYRVAGRRAPDRADKLDVAWIAVVADLAGRLPGRVLVTGGRSSGARVACRTAGATGAAGVICLAFPLHPPGRPDKSRAAELTTVGVPALVVQGERDPFGGPADLPPGPDVIAVPGDHSLRKIDDASIERVVDWLRQRLA